MIIHLDIAAPIELVWKAITDEAEIPRWFAPVARVTPPDGTIFLSWGPGMEGEALIAAWDPPSRFQWKEAATTVEFTLEAIAGGARFTLIQSGNESNAAAWHTFFAMLKYGLEHYPNEPAVNVTVLRTFDIPRERALEHKPAFPGRTILEPAPGFRCQTVDALEHSMLAYFIESAGPATSFTFEWILFRTARAHADDAGRQLDHFFNSSFATLSR